MKLKCGEAWELSLYMREVLCKCKAGRQESALTMPTVLAS